MVGDPEEAGQIVFTGQYAPGGQFNKEEGMNLNDAIRAGLLLAGLLSAAAGWAQNWPTKPVRVIVTYPAGGVVDVLARAATTEMSKDGKQPIWSRHAQGPAQTSARMWPPRRLPTAIR